MSAPAPKAEQPKAPAVADRSAARSSSQRAVTALGDNRPMAVAQRQQQALINSSPRMQRAGAQQALIAQSPRQQVAQRQEARAIANSPLQAEKNGMQEPTSIPYSLPNTGAVVQRYAEANGGGRISEAEQLLWRDKTRVFAAPAQFGQAQGLAGDVSFVPGEADATYPALNLVTAQHKGQSPIAEATTGFDPVTERGEIEERALEDYYPTADSLADDLKYAINEEGTWEGMDDETREREFLSADEGERDEIIDMLATLAVELFEVHGNFHERVVPVIAAYFQQQGIMQDRPLMPSDCGQIAATILGAMAMSRNSEDPHGAVGEAYGKTARLGDDARSEWDHHFAAIIMADGPDHVTMENAAAKKSDNFSKPYYDHTWYFEMYGPSEGQTFADKYDRDLGH